MTGPLVNLEAERELLAGMLHFSEARAFALRRVVAEDLAEPTHRTLFDLLVSLAEEHGAMDAAMVRHALEEGNLLAEAGGREALEALASLALIPESGMAAAKKVRDLALRRRAVQVGSALLQAAPDLARGVSEIVDDAETELAALRRSGDREPETLSRVLARLMERLSSGKPLMDGFRTGFFELDRLTGGFHAGELVLLASRPGVGKSAFAANLIERMATKEKPIAMFSLEMSNDEIALRLLANRSAVSLWTLRQEGIGDANRARLETASKSLSGAGVYLEDLPAMKLSDLRFAARDLVKQRGVRLIIVDYLQLVRGTRERGDNRYQEVASISHGLKNLARQTNIPVLAVAALRRPAVGIKPGLPTMDSLRESGDLEQDADVVLLLHREHDNPTDAKLLIAKQRNGPTGIVDLTWRPEFLRFEDAAERFRQAPCLAYNAGEPDSGSPF